MNTNLLTILASIVLSAMISSAITLSLTKKPTPLHAETRRELDVDRLIVRKELIVSDTGKPWEAGFEAHGIPRGLYACPKSNESGGLWVRGRLVKCDIDDPFDDRFHAINRDGTPFKAPGHISWNVWIDGAWRQMAIIQGEGLENSEIPMKEWSGGNHPGRLRFQSFRPNHPEPLTDATIGQGKMSIGGGGFGGGGLPYPAEVLELWGGDLQQHKFAMPDPPVIVKDDGSGQHAYAIVPLGPQGRRSTPSPTATARGLATLRWDNIAGADSYIVQRDGQDATPPLRIEGSEKTWTDKGKSN